jgi:hypothetical protein
MQDSGADPYSMDVLWQQQSQQRQSKSLQLIVAMHYHDSMRPLFQIFCRAVDFVQNALLDRSLLLEQKALTRRLEKQSLRSAEESRYPPGSSQPKKAKVLPK